MTMRRILYIIISLPAVLACEKVWEEDLREKALDTIRGYYEIESATWEGAAPVDINGDGSSSYDYYAEWNSVDYGAGAHGASIRSEGGYIEIPYTADINASWGGPLNVYRMLERITLEVKVIIEGDDSRLEFIFPEDCQGLEFNHTGYGEFEVRKEITSMTQSHDTGEASPVTGPVLFRFKRKSYKAY